MARKSAASKTDSVSEAPQAKVAEKISFDNWFSLEVARAGRLKNWQRNQLAAFMKGQGLADREEKEKYDQAFTKF
jgi:hypothetical protein